MPFKMWGAQLKLKCVFPQDNGNQLSLGGHVFNNTGDEVRGSSNDTDHHWDDIGGVVANTDGFPLHNHNKNLTTVAGIVGLGVVFHPSVDLSDSQQFSGANGSRQDSFSTGFANRILRFSSLKDFD